MRPKGITLRQEKALIKLLGEGQTRLDALAMLKIPYAWFEEHLKHNGWLELEVKKAEEDYDYEMIRREERLRPPNYL